MTFTTLAKDHAGWLGFLGVIAVGIFSHIESVDRREEMRLQFQLQHREIVATSNAVKVVETKAAVAEAKAEVASNLVANVAVKVESNTVAVAAARNVNVLMAGAELVEKAEQKAIKQVEVANQMKQEK